MDIKERNRIEMEKAKEVAYKVNHVKDPRVRRQNTRPIIHFKQMFEETVRINGNRIAFMQRFEKEKPFREISYKQALEDVNNLGTSLIDLGLKDKRIAVVGDNCYQWATSYLAITCGTGIVVPLDKELSPRDLKQLVIEAEVSAVMFTEKFKTTFKEMKDSGDTNIETLIQLNGTCEEDVFSWDGLIEKGRRLISQGDRRFIDAEVDGTAMGILLFTSGTTGIAKGVMLSHKNVCANMMLAPTVLPPEPGDVFLSILPLHHTYECTCGFLIPLYKGSTIAFCEGLKYLPKNLKEIRPTTILGVPLIFENLYKKIMKNIRKQGKEKAVERVIALNKITRKVGIEIVRPLLKDIHAVLGGRLKLMVSGGAAIDPKVLEFFNDIGIAAVQGYGMTECSPMNAINPDTYKYMRSDSAGYLMPQAEGKVIDKDENGVGELCFKGDHIMLGYYNMPEETSKVIQDGWFHTGDLGYIDQDNFVYITGRKKNVIITKNGKNVFPEELEYLLGKSPYISETMVWGDTETHKDDVVIVATIKPDMEEVANVLGEKEKNIEDLETLLWKEVDKINEELPLFKKIKKIKIRQEEFEKTTAQKIKRFVESNKVENKVEAGI